MLPIQWIVFAEHILLDEKEKAEFNRDTVEYLASFQNYQTVKTIKDAREEQQQEEEQPDLPEQISSEEIFYKQLKEMGINLDPQKIDQAKNSEIKRQKKEEEETLPKLSTRQQLQQDMARVIRSKE